MSKLLIIQGSRAVALVVLASLWAPVALHYRVPFVLVAGEMVATGRQLPPEEVLSELKGFDFFPRPVVAEEAIPIAEKILKGRLEVPGHTPTRVTFPFDPHDLDGVPPDLDLTIADLSVAQILLDAYDRSGREDFLRAACDVILAVDRYERHAWFPRGLFWNDQAIATRMVTLANFWHHYRHHSSYNPEVARTIFEMAARSAERLAKPALFTVASNHGVMQNLALWHMCVAFPTLPHAKEYVQIALNRLRVQLQFYINDEGIVLEHSAGYHKAGLRFLGMACRYLTLLHQDIPSDWLAKYKRAEDFYALLRRPDGSLPVFGDTDSAADPIGPSVLAVNPEGAAGPLQYRTDWRPGQSISLFRVAGYAIWWDGLANWPRSENLSQTVVVWSEFPGHAHQHADAMSVLLWARGQTWWTNVGYWLESNTGWANANSWEGSDAPHFLGEPPDAETRVRLVASGNSGSVIALTLQREGPGSFRASRQLVHLIPNVWVIMDHVSGAPNQQASTTWTAARDVHLSADQNEGVYKLESEGHRGRLDAFLSGSSGTSIKQFRGSLHPFAGWVVKDLAPQPASALIVQQPGSDSWALALWKVEDVNSTLPSRSQRPIITRWGSEKDWEARLPSVAGTISVRRQGNNIFAHNAGNASATEVLHLTDMMSPDSERARLLEVFAQALGEYPRFKDYLEYRGKYTLFFSCLVIVQEILLAGCKKYIARWFVILRVLTAIGWAGLGVWFYCVSFRA